MGEEKQKESREAGTVGIVSDIVGGVVDAGLILVQGTAEAAPAVVAGVCEVAEAGAECIAEVAGEIFSGGL